MSDHSAIEWTDASWNPVTGCSKVSPGCAHCYAEALSLRFKRSALPWLPENAAENVRLHPERLTLPLRWRDPKRIFVNSMSDLFHELVPDAFIERVFAVMALAPRHTFQVLTKRPERMRSLLSNPGVRINVAHAAYDVLGARRADGTADFELASRRSRGATDTPMQWPLRNVWLGTSVENQHWADVRIPLLLQAPAAVRFLSCEPLLGPVDLGRWVFDREASLRNVMRAPWAMNRDQAEAAIEPMGIGWVIAGGESGRGHRPMELDWVRALRDQCQAAGVAFFYKQPGGSRPGGEAILDGREWREFPTVAA